jgi:hypothetical protein
LFFFHCFNVVKDMDLNTSISSILLLNNSYIPSLNK